MEQRSPEWYSARKYRITASAVGGILGLSPFQKPSDVMRRMINEYKGLPNEFTGNAATEWGVFNEDGAIQQYELKTGNRVQKCGFFAYEDWLGCSPDGLLENNGMIEVKCPFGLRSADDPKFKTAQQQTHYYAQIQLQMYVMGRTWCDFYQWAPHGESLETVKYDKPFMDTILKPLRMFYDQYLIEREK